MPSAAFALLLLLAVAAAPAPAAAAPAVQLIAETTEGFARPHDLTLGPRGQYLYVADMNNNVVKVLDPRSLVVLGLIGEGELAAPHDVTFDSQGRLLVADTGHNRIAIYQVSGTSGQRIDQLSGTMASPEGVSTGPGGRVYVTNAGTDTLLAFQGHRLLATFGGPDTFSSPHDVERGPDGKLYVADPGNDRILVLDPDLQSQQQIRADFDQPKYLALDKKGRLFVADQHNDQLVVFDPRGQLIVAVHRVDHRELDRPEGVAVKGNTIWVSDTYNDRILRLELQGQ